MKLKRIFVFLLFLSVSAMLFAQLATLKVDAGYMYHKLETLSGLDSLDPTMQDELSLLVVGNDDSAATLKGVEQFNAFSAGINLNIFGYFYFGANLAFPYRIQIRGFDPATAFYERTLSVNEAQKVKAYIADAYAGGGLPFCILDGAIDIFVGAHVSCNYIDIKRDLDKPLFLSNTALENVTDYTKSAALGVGGVLSMAYYFPLLKKNEYSDYDYDDITRKRSKIGIAITLNYSSLLMHFRTLRSFSGYDQKTGGLVDKVILDTMKHTKPKKQTGHNLTLSVGLTAKF